MVWLDVDTLRDSKDIHLWKYLLHTCRCLRRGEDSRLNLMLVQPSCYFIKILWPTIPNHRNNLIPDIIRKRIKCKRYWFYESKLCLSLSLSNAREITFICQAMEYFGWVMWCRNLSTDIHPSIVWLLLKTRFPLKGIRANCVYERFLVCHVSFCNSRFLSNDVIAFS